MTDVKVVRPQGPVLSAGSRVQAPRSASQSCAATGDALSTDSDGETVIVTSERKGVVRSQPQALCRQGMGVPKVHPILAQLGVPDAKQALSDLQALLIQERSGRKSLLNNAKRFYGTARITVGNGVFQHQSLARIAAGATSANRNDDVVSGLSVTVHANFVRTYTATPNATHPPRIRWVLWRDKVPATPGTATATLSTGTNPPSSSTDMYTRLTETDVKFNMLAVRPSDTFDRYHVYETGILDMSVEKLVFGGINTVAYPFSRLKIINHDLHNVEITFASDTVTTPMLNDIYFSIFSDFDYTGSAMVDTLWLTWDLAFRDKQL